MQVVQYSLGGLKCLVQFATDAFSGEASDVLAASDESPVQDKEGGELEDLQSVRRGRMTATEDLIELRSMDGRYARDLGYISSNLWLTGVKDVYFAR